MDVVAGVVAVLDAVGVLLHCCGCFYCVAAVLLWMLLQCCCRCWCSVIVDVVAVLLQDFVMDVAGVVVDVVAGVGALLDANNNAKTLTTTLQQHYHYCLGIISH